MTQNELNYEAIGGEKVLSAAAEFEGMVPVRMLTHMAAPSGSSWAGDVVLIDQAAAAVLIEGGFAEAVNLDPDEVD